MFGIELSRSEWAGLVAVAYIVLRILYSVGRVLWWYATDARRVVAPQPFLSFLTAVAVAVMAVALVSVLTDWPARGVAVAGYAAAGFAGFFLGLMFDLVLDVRMWAVSNWLTAFRVPQYRERLLHGDGAVRLAAVQRLAGLGLYATPARPELLAAMRGDESADVRSEAAQAVLYSLADPLPEDDVETPREARAALADADPRVRTTAAAILVTFRAIPPAGVIPVLCAGLASENEDAAGIAARALEKLGPDAEPAIDALRASALRPERPNAFAPAALGKIGAPAVPALIEILERGDETCRWCAADALGDMGELARPALPALRKVAEGKDDTLAHTVKRAIKKIGGDVE